MQDDYEAFPYAEPEPKKGLSGWVIALIIIAALLAICCVCLLIVLLLTPALLGPSIGNVFSTIVETVEATTPVPLP